MRNTLETRLGIFFALALFVSVLILEMVGAFDFFKGGYSIQASFKNAQELKKGDPVKIAGVEVGRVEEVELDRIHNLACVTMKIQKRYTNSIPLDSKAVIRFTGLMGQSFVAIEGGVTNIYLLPGGTLQTVEQPDIGSLMQKMQDVADGIEGLTKSFSPNTLSTLIGPLNDFIQQNSPVLTAVIANLRAVSDRVAQGHGTVGKLVSDDALYNSALATATNFQAVSGDIKGLVADAESAINQARLVVAQINAGQGTIGRLATDDALYREATNAMTNLREILQKVNTGTGSVARLVNDETLVKNAKLSLQKLDKAMDSLEDQGPLSVLGLVIGTLF